MKQREIVQRTSLTFTISMKFQMKVTLNNSAYKNATYFNLILFNFIYSVEYINTYVLYFLPKISHVLCSGNYVF